MQRCLYFIPFSCDRSLPTLHAGPLISAMHTHFAQSDSCRAKGMRVHTGCVSGNNAANIICSSTSDTEIEPGSAAISVWPRGKFNLLLQKVTATILKASPTLTNALSFQSGSASVSGELRCLPLHPTIPPPPIHSYRRLRQMELQWIHLPEECIRKVVRVVMAALNIQTTQVKKKKKTGEGRTVLFFRQPPSLALSSFAAFKKEKERGTHSDRLSEKS